MQKPNTLQIVVIVITFLVIYFFLRSTILSPASMVEQSKPYMQEVENKVAQDAETQYYIAKRQGDKIQTYVQAELVAAAYLQANDEANYDIWKGRQDSIGKKLGMGTIIQ